MLGKTSGEPLSRPLDLGLSENSGYLILGVLLKRILLFRVLAYRVLYFRKASEVRFEG